MEISEHYVWLAWSLALLAAWGALYVSFPRLRQAMMWSSLLTLPFGLSQPLFLLSYWHPPGLWELARRIHFDLESFIYCFAIGGTASILADVIMRSTPTIPAKPPSRARHPQWHNAALATPVLVFPLMLFSTNRPLIAGVVAMCAGATVRLIVLPELARKTIFGGILFTCYYAAAFWFLDALAPRYVATVWDVAPLRLGHFAGVPLIELAFAFSFGCMWSGLYEQARWTMMTTGYGCSTSRTPS